MKYSRDSLYKRLIKLSRNRPTQKVQIVDQSHNLSKSIKLEPIQIVENKKVYIIKSLSNPSQQHYIIKNDETCIHSSRLNCKKCDICIHTFHCSCIDNVIKANICKGISTLSRRSIALHYICLTIRLPDNTFYIFLMYLRNSNIQYFIIISLFY